MAICHERDSANKVTTNCNRTADIETEWLMFVKQKPPTFIAYGSVTIKFTILLSTLENSGHFHVAPTRKLIQACIKYIKFDMMKLYKKLFKQHETCTTKSKRRTYEKRYQ